jgi:diadenosine tetraphosphate (Ap4A) HIT family hydrolase
VAGLEWDAYAGLQKLAWEAARTLERALQPRRVYVAALGSSSPLAKSFPHLHLHVVPLYDDSEASKPANIFSWAHGVWVYERGEGQRLAAELIEKSPWRRP